MIRAKIIITGASGFLGKSLVDELSQMERFNVVGVSRTAKSSKYIEKVNSYLETPNGDILIHLAECPVQSEVNWQGDNYLKNSSDVLSSLIEKNYKKIIYISSAAVYGHQLVEPVDESGEAFGQDTYSINKIENEKKVVANGGVVIRLANVIGPGMSRQNVLSEILDQVINDNEEVIVRDGSPVRDYIWIDDVISAIKKIIINDVKGIFNVGTGIGTSVMKLAQITCDVMKKNRMKIISLQDAKKHSTIVLDVKKMRTNLNWQAEVNIETAILKLIDNRKEP